MKESGTNGLESHSAMRELGLAEVENYRERFFLKEQVTVEISLGQFPDSEMVFTTATGAYLIDFNSGSCLRFLKGKYYGAARTESHWFFARSNNQGYRDHLRNERISDICCVRFDSGKPVDCKAVVYGIPGEVHQIDIHRHQLLVPHTDFNELLLFSVPEMIACRSPLAFEDAARVPLDIRPSAHINSVFATEEEFLVLAHNYSWKTDIESELIILSRHSGKEKRIFLPGRSAHNIVPWAGEYMFCNSDGRNLQVGRRVLFQTDTFLRGLSITEQNIFVGGSDVQFEEYQRRSHDSYIYVLDRVGNNLATLRLPAMGDIYEIRQLTSPDFAMSEARMVV